MASVTELSEVPASNKEIMSLFGSSREQSPLIQSEKFVDKTDRTGSSKNQQIEPHPQQDALIEPTGDSGQDATSEDGDLASTKLSSKDYQQYRRWYYNDLNLVNAFESAAAGDLAHNLLGFALEKKAHLAQRPSTNSSSWTSKSRWISDPEAEFMRNTWSWTAWPLHPDLLPSRDKLLSDPRPNKHSELPRKKRKILHPAAELDDALSGLAMEHARDQFSLRKQMSKVTPLKSTDRKANTMEPDFESLSFSMDEEFSFTLLKPSVRQVAENITKLFTGLTASRSAQIPHSAKQLKSKLLPHPKIHIQTTRDDLQTTQNLLEDDDLSDTTVPDSYGISTTDQPGLRDWSDVLAMAANIGWNQNALTRAVARCSVMFGETMSLTSLHGAETPSVEVEHNFADSQVAPIPLFGWSIDTLQCPHHDCERHLRKFTSRMYLIDHIVSAHNWDPRFELSPVFASQHVPEGWSLDSLRCPDTTCAQYGHTFSQKDAIIDHMLLRHRWDPRTLRKDSERLVDDVHVDGFMEAIVRKQGWNGKNRVNSPQNAIEIAE